MRQEKKHQRVVLLSVYAVLLATAVILMFLIPANFHAINRNPRIHRGTVDYKGWGDLSGKPSGIHLAGEWEFFYNRWIVTDKASEPDPEHPVPDGLLHIPGRWTGKVFKDGKKLPKTGYASYRLTVKNMNLGDVKEINLRADDPNTSYRTFVNGAASCFNGKMSKNRKEAFTDRNSSGVPAPIDPSPDATYTLVIEISDNSDGGLLVGPGILARSDSLKSFDFLYGIFVPGIAGGLLIACVFSIFSFVSPEKKDGQPKGKLNRIFAWIKRYLPTGLFMLSIALNLLFDYDSGFFILDICGLNGILMPRIQFFTVFLVLFAFAFLLHINEGFKFRRAEWITLTLCNVLSAALYFPLLGTRALVLAAFIPVLTVAWFVVKLTKSKLEFKYFAPYLTICLFLMGALIAQMSGAVIPLAVDISPTVTICLSALLIPVILIRFFKMRESASALRLTAESEATNQSIRLEVHTYGEFGIKVRGTEVCFDAQKSKEMLAYLIHIRGSYISKDYLCEVLWPENKCSTTQLSARFRNALSKLNRALKQHGIGTNELVISKKNQISVDFARLDCDFIRDESSGGGSRHKGKYMSQFDWDELAKLR